MKTIHLFSLCLCAILFFSCNGNSDPAIVGTWNVLEVTCDDGLVISELDGMEFATTEFTYFWDDIEGCTFVFNADNTNVNSGSYTQVMTTTVTTYGMVFSPQTTEIPITYTSTSNWELDGDVLIFSNVTGTSNGTTQQNNEEVEYDIISMTDESMELSTFVEIETSMETGGQTTLDLGTQTISILLEKQ